MELFIPQGWEQITPDWMTAALGSHFSGAKVGDVTVAMRDDGTNRRVRLALEYSAGTGPSTVFANAVDPEHADLVALASGLYHEPPLFSSESLCRLIIRRSTRRSSKKTAATS